MFQYPSQTLTIWSGLFNSRFNLLMHHIREQTKSFKAKNGNNLEICRCVKLSKSVGNYDFKEEI